jgi:hypothetical protein
MGGRTNGSSKGNSYEGQKSKDGELHVCGLEVGDLELKGDKKRSSGDRGAQENMKVGGRKRKERLSDER